MTVTLPHLTLALTHCSYVDGSTPKAPVTLPILEFTKEENLDPGKSYNLYPIRENHHSSLVMCVLITHDSSLDA